MKTSRNQGKTNWIPAYAGMTLILDIFKRTTANNQPYLNMGDKKQECKGKI